MACDARVSQPQMDTLPRPRGPGGGCAASAGSSEHPLSTPGHQMARTRPATCSGFPGPLGVGREVARAHPWGL